MTREGLKAIYKKQASELIAELTEMKAELEKPLYSRMELQDILAKMNYLVENMIEPTED